jgi:hypothetical protein
MDKETFRINLCRLKTAVSITGKIYSGIKIKGNQIFYIRNENNKYESLSLDELYTLYISEKCINTVVAKRYISSRSQSPAVAIVNELKLIVNSQGFKVSADVNKPFFSGDSSSKTIIKDETKFFSVLSKLIGEDFLFSKSIGKPVNSSQVFLSKNFLDYKFEKNIIKCYTLILDALGSNNGFSSDSLSHNIDGLIINHPFFENRIVEFDEEQHFTPARKDTLDFLKTFLKEDYITSYSKICTDVNYLNNAVLTKHRIKNKLKSTPSTFKYFVKWLELSNEKPSGYICNKSGFEFLGGRIAQRAYYDCLRDTAHLSPLNKQLLPPLRFSKKQFEDETKLDFNKISDTKLKEILQQLLYENL